jgi:ribonuclease P protein component
LSAFPYRIYFKAYNCPADQVSPVLFGVGVSKRYFKKAVDRNRIKRLTREVYRHRKHVLENLLAGRKSSLDIFLIFTGKEIPSIAQCEKGIAGGLEKLEIMLTATK